MPFLKNTWYMFGLGLDVVIDAPQHKVIADEPVLVFRKQDGSLSAIRDLCPHRFVPLHKGRQIGDVIQCGYHGLRFGGDGICTHNPVAGAPIPKAARVTAWQVAEKHTIVWVWLGAGTADPSLIPDFSFLADPKRANVGGYTLAHADYQLCIDNLSDLTHVQFVHEEYQASDAFDRLQFNVTQEGEEVHARLVFPGGHAPKVYQNAVGDPDMLVDIVNQTRWSAPSCVRLTSSVHKAGASEPMAQIMSAHILTPETAKTSHYFYINSRDYALEDRDADENIRTWQRQGFTEEDKPMLEAQQRCIRDDDIMTLGPVLLPTDAAAIRVRRILAAKMKQEGLPSAPAERHV